MTLPAPLTPPDCNLRDFGFMPWEITRFRQSGLVANEEPEAILAAVLLWGEAWQSVPAASLPDDDKALARAAGYGRAVDAFLAVKAGAMRGFVLCSDGRLYHPTVAEKAREAWQHKLRQRHRTFLAAVRKHNERNPNARVQGPSFEEWLERGRPENVTRDTTRPEPRQDELDLPDCPVRARARTGAETVPNDQSRDTTPMSRVTGEKVTRDDPPKSRVKQHPRDRDRDRDRETHESLSESPQTPLAEIAAELAELAGLPLATPKQREAAEAQVHAWSKLGISVETMREAVRAFTAKAETPTRSLRRFDEAVRLLHAKGGAKAEPPEPPGKPSTSLGPDDADQRISDMRESLRTAVGARSYDGWLRPLRFTLNGSGVILTAPTAFLADWVQSNLSPQLAEAAKAVGFARVQIQPPSR